jgi:cytidylate kinase
VIACAVVSELLEIRPGVAIPLDEVLADQRRRDHDDSQRVLAPLKAAPDAVVVDTTGLDLGQVVDRCERETLARLKHLKSGPQP